MGKLQGFIAQVEGEATISNTAKDIDHADFGFTAAQLDAAEEAFITCRNNPVSYLFGEISATVTASTGARLAAGSDIIIRGNDNIQGLQFIREGASDGNISVILLS